MTTYLNMTPHIIVLDNGGDSRIFPPCGQVARVITAEPSPLPPEDGVPVFLFDSTGRVEGLPTPSQGTVYIVSLFVGTHPSVKGRRDVIFPRTGPNDGAIRNDKGHVMAVRRFLTA
jgi:hypothetical protein